MSCLGFGGDFDGLQIGNFDAVAVDELPIGNLEDVTLFVESAAVVEALSVCCINAFSMSLKTLLRCSFKSCRTIGSTNSTLASST